MKLLTLAVLSVGVGFSQNNDCDSLDKCEEALKTNRQSSLIHLRIGEIYFQHAFEDEAGPLPGRVNFMKAANSFRASLNGDLQPRWTEVWAHINLGKIFDITGQRDRALNEYRLALKTKDNTRGALDEARKYTETPYGSN